MLGISDKDIELLRQQAVKLPDDIRQAYMHVIKFVDNYRRPRGRELTDGEVREIGILFDLLSKLPNLSSEQAQRQQLQHCSEKIRSITIDYMNVESERDVIEPLMERSEELSFQTKTFLREAKPTIWASFMKPSPKKPSETSHMLPGGSSDTPLCCGCVIS